MSVVIIDKGFGVDDLNVVFVVLGEVVNFVVVLDVFLDVELFDLDVYLKVEVICVDFFFVVDGCGFIIVC